LSKYLYSILYLLFYVKLCFIWLEVAKKVEKRKKELSEKKYAESTQRKKTLEFMRDQHSRQENKPVIGKLINRVFSEPLHNGNNAWQQINELILQHACAKSAIPKACTNLADLLDCQFSKYLSTLKQIKATRLYKKVKKWHQQGRNGPLSYCLPEKKRKYYAISTCIY
jgi:hypothetical protein